MLTVQKKHLFKIIREKKACYWFVLEGKNELDFMQDEGVTEDESIEALTSVLDNITGGVVLVKLSDMTNERKSKEGSRKAQNFEFFVRSTGASENNTGAPDNMVFTLMKEISALQNKIIENNYNYQLQELNKKIDDLQNGNNNPLLTDTLKSIAGLLLPGGVTPVSGTAAGEAKALGSTPAMVAGDKEKIREALNILGTIDRNLPDTLINLANFAKNNTSQYFIYLKMLNK